MRRVSRTAAFLIALSCVASVMAQPAQYNTSDTFQPGKKYNCVPTADRKGWNCNEIGKADQAPRSTSEQSAPAAAASPTKPATLATAPSMPVAPEPIRAAPSSAPTTNSDRSSRLPSYLTNESATAPAMTTSPPSTISATANRANAPPVPTEEKHVTPIMPPPVEKPARVVATHPATPTPPKPTPPRETSHAINSANDDFMSLAGDHFVIELAHASRRSDLAASRDAIHIPRGEFYEVHFRQNGGDAWLLVWGSFDTIDAARSARNALSTSTSAPVGFPRRVAPLQAEARRVSE